MSIKWALGTAVLIVSGMFALPGIVSADPVDPGEITNSTTTYCDDGSFAIELDFVGGKDGGDGYVEIEDNSYAETPPPAGMTATGEDGLDELPSPDEWEFENYEVVDNFFTLSGDYDSVAALSDGAVDVDYWLELNGGDDTVVPGTAGTARVSSGPDGDDNPDNDWEKCIISYCKAGDVDGGNDYEFQATPTNDCDPVRLCVDGESITVTEFQAETLNGEEGSCVPSEDPPASTTIAAADPGIDEVVETTDSVAEVSPAVEVAALPAAGISSTEGGKTTWVALLGLALLCISGVTTLMARRS